MFIVFCFVSFKILRFISMIRMRMWMQMHRSLYFWQTVLNVINYNNNNDCINFPFSIVRYAKNAIWNPLLRKIQIQTWIG